ncbi:hypothetical protein [Vibrio parahaemolyticus]|uniref:hypothetical protein n=1 Tax=Vibrio parahaemolyticus TaxID=670 RepID=UPI0017841828|nr:hypothetical protein [Vibrio parahaemolyticus]MBD6963900.1 hypothetical protein [Vibrio parahaemolyticus]
MIDDIAFNSTPQCKLPPSKEGGNLLMLMVEFCMPVLPLYWSHVFHDTAQLLGFRVKGTQLILNNDTRRAVFLIERDIDGFVIHQKGQSRPRYLMDELDCLDFCQWLRRFAHRFTHHNRVITWGAEEPT